MKRWRRCAEIMMLPGNSVLDDPRRIQGVDLARGVAVIGMFAAHLTVTPLFELREPTTWVAMVNGHSSVLFAMLAGVSLALTTGRGTPLTGSKLAVARRLLVGRGAVVWGIGVLIALSGVPVNVILPAYGVLFLVATGLLGLSVRALVPLALLLAVTMPFFVAWLDVPEANEGARNEGVLSILFGWYYPFPVWIAFIAAGLAAGRILSSSSSLVRPALALVGAGGVLAFIGHRILGPIAYNAENNGPWVLTVLVDDAHSSGVGEVIGSGGVALAVTGMSVLVCLTPIRHVLWPLRSLGSMPLSAYVAHLLVWLAWMLKEQLVDGVVDPLEGFRSLGPFWPVTLGIIVACMLWTSFRGKGPLEDMVSRLSARIMAPTLRSISS